MKRVFLGLDLPSQLKEKVEDFKLNKDLSCLPIKLVEKENSHIALKFLDKLSDQQIDLVNKKIDEATRGFKNFEIQLKNIIAFPDLKNPKVLALKVISLNLEGLAKKIFKALEDLKFVEFKDRKYTPHITLGRIKNNLNPAELEKISGLEFKDSFMVDQIQMFSSTLTVSGPIYKILENFKLR